MCVCNKRWLFRRMEGNVTAFISPPTRWKLPLLLCMLFNMYWTMCATSGTLCALFPNQNANYSTQVKGHFHTLCSTTVEGRGGRANYPSEYGGIQADTMFLTLMVLDGQIESIIIHSTHMQLTSCWIIFIIILLFTNRRYSYERLDLVKCFGVLFLN